MLLAIYLNDHLAGATAILQLARRTAASNRDSDHGVFLAELSEEIAEDRESLLEVMRALEVRRDPAKVLAAWAAEKAGRLKLNGRLLSYSPYSRVLELEVLLLGVHGKLALWQALQQLEPSEPLLDGELLRDLRERAEDQIARLQDHRLRAAARAFA